MSLISADEFSPGEWAISVHDTDGGPVHFYLMHVATHITRERKIDGGMFTVRHLGVTHELSERSDVAAVTPLVHAHGPIARRMQEALTRDIEARMAKFPPPAPPPYVPPPPPTLGGPNLTRAIPKHEDDDVRPLYRAGWLDAIEWLRENGYDTRCESGCCGSPSEYEEAIEALTEHVSEAVDGAW